MLVLFWIYIVPSLATDTPLELVGHVALLLVTALSDFMSVCILWGFLGSMFKWWTMSPAESDFREKWKTQHDEYVSAKPFIDRVTGDKGPR